MSTTRTQVVKFLKQGEKGERGATLRGPQAWSDCIVGYAFQAGVSGDEWKDVVLYNGNYYSCKKSHAKTASNYPGSTTDRNNGYWQLGDKIELVATKILLATYALVENLGVTAIEMKDSSGKVLFQAKDGKVTCRTGDFEDVSVTGNLTVAQLRYKANVVTDGKLGCSFVYGSGSCVLPSLAEGEFMRVVVFNPQITKTYMPMTLTGESPADRFLSESGDYFRDQETSIVLVGWYELIGYNNGGGMLWLYQTIRSDM